MARTGFGQFNQQLVQQFHHMLVDVLRAVVGMERQNEERELVEELFQHRNQVSFADFLDGTDDFELRHFIDGVDMIDPFYPIEIALMDRIHAQIPWLAIGLGLPTLTEAGTRGAGFLEVLANMLVTRAVP